MSIKILMLYFLSLIKFNSWDPIQFSGPKAEKQIL